VAKKRNWQRPLSRREMLGLLGAAGVMAVVGCGDDGQPRSREATSTPAQAVGGAATTTPPVTATTSATPAPVACVLTAALTEGPYFVDERLGRSDLTSDPTDGSIKEGVPLRLNLTVSSVEGAACTPLVGALVDMWHCDALGVYSDVSGAGQPDTTGQKFLRGYQITDENGQVEFQTIYPGWYSGRTIHIHFKVRTDPDAAQGFEFTSQLFFDETITDAVVAQVPYNEKGTPDTSNAADNIYQPDLVLPLTADGDGYTAAFHVGVSMA
jgi:protocatechuate 3,4-dioxygenase beta subunit